MEFDLTFYQGKKILITGHTGFKGAWLCKLLDNLGADVTGYALEPPTEPSLFDVAGIGQDIHSIIGDIRDYEALRKAFAETEPDIVFHLAAQPIVRESYRAPRLTYETNVMGTVNLLECVRETSSVRSVLNITTDKVYYNKEWMWGYRENERLCGTDPYSNSKSCSELVTYSYCRSFFTDGEGEMTVPISTVRAGNVIGGGDYAVDRIIPDCVRAAERGERIVIRNPYSIRPYQHVLDALYAYLMVAAKQFDAPKYAGSYNVGPNERDCIRTGELAELFIRHWGEGLQTDVGNADERMRESNFLKLDCSKLKETFGWEPRWGVDRAVEKVVEWSRCRLDGGDIRKCMDRQIEEFLYE